MAGKFLSKRLIYRGPTSKVGVSTIFSQFPITLITLNSNLTRIIYLGHYSNPMPTRLPRTMLIDMNSFFASVEQQANPLWRGRPLGVGNSLHETSCLIGTSKEAKKLGIGTGTSIYKAKRIYPNIIVTRSDPDKYREVNDQMNRIFRDYSPSVEPYSIDESFLEIPDDKGLLIAAEIKRRIKSEIGEWLTCSIGIGENKFLAKLAGAMQKPDGLTVIWRDQLPEIYKHKQLSDLWGIARGWQKRLAKLNITSPLQLLDYPVQNLISLFGKPGFDIWQRVNGLEIDSIESSPLTGEDVTLVTDEGGFLGYPPPRGSRPPLPPGGRGNLQKKTPKTLWDSWVLNFRTTDKEKLKSVILRLAEKASRRMRREGLMASGIYLSVSLTDACPQRLSTGHVCNQACDGGRGSYFHKSRKIKGFIETGFELYEQSLKVWDAWKFPSEVMHIAVGFTYLSPKVKQLSLFVDRNATLTPVLDSINNKYGEFAIRSGLLTKTSDFAPDAIAFTHVT